MPPSKKTVQLFGLSALSGVLLWLSWPERGFTPLVFIAFVPLLFVNHYFNSREVIKRRRKIFSLFFLAMLVWNVLTTWWIYNSTDVGSIVAIGLNSLFMAIVWMLFHSTNRKYGITIGYFSLFCYLIGFEYLHLTWEISWPWLTLGNVFAVHPEYVQWYEFTGVLGGSIWVIAANLFFFVLAKNIFNRDLLKQLRRINSVVALTGTAVLLSAPLIFSKWLYNRHVDKGEPVSIVVVQPNIDPYNMKFSGNGDDQLAKMLQLASTVVDSSTKFVLFPETALADGLWEENMASHKQIRTIEKFIHAFPNVTVLIGAATAREYDKDSTPSETARKFHDSENYYDEFNTALMIDSSNRIQVYHKTRLVPGIEKMPYPKVFGFLEKIALDLGGTSGSLGIQENRTNFIAPDSTLIAPAICYESIYGGFLSDYVKAGAQLIFIITNDGWWGNTPGHRQHMNYARLRAIEFRKSIARSANTGISCFIDQRGDLLQQTGWWEEDAIKQTLYKNNIRTFYARHGDYIGVAAAILAVVLFFMTLYKKYFRK
ncbi:MAG: apolipoprotein N-acyltransferase [Bacteroidetes bacterium]|nr:apolipoprotein N-acyltransferase [Bacteroidota bacterium]